MFGVAVEVRASGRLTVTPPTALINMQVLGAAVEVRASGSSA